MEKDVLKYVKRQLNYGITKTAIKRVLMMTYKRNPAEIQAILKQVEKGK